jgi:glycosyltransferase involved in cell wall biosynthesis
MRVCFVSKEVAGIRGGGIGIYVVEAGKALSAYGHEVWLITQDPGEAKRDRLSSLPGFHRVQIAGENVPADRRSERLFHGDPHYAYSMLVHETLQAMRAMGVIFDYIEFPDYEAEGLIPIREQKLFRTYGSTVLGVMLHSPTYECFLYDQQMHRASLSIREVCLLEDDVIRNAPVLNCPSKGLLELVRQRLGLPQTNGSIIRYPMSLPRELSTTPAVRHSLDDLQFLYFGRIEPRKGVENLIEAFRMLPRLRLRLVGADVPYSAYGRSFRAHLERRAPTNVEFIGEVPRKRMLEMIKAADVCIFPSLFENWPNACIEAMAAGRVVIGSRHGGMAEMIKHGESGFLVDGRSAADIVRVIREDLGSALSRLDRIGASASNRMRAFSEQETYARAIERHVTEFQAGYKPLPALQREARKVSIVIPFYNDRDTIDEAVLSACAQYHRNTEIVIVNDGSPLADADTIMQQLCKCDPRVRVIYKKNGGLSSARNYGVQNATGEYVLFLDADNVLRPDYAGTAVEILERNPELVFAVPHVQFFDGTTGSQIGVYNPIPFDRATGLLINRFGDAGAMFRRSVFVEGGIAYDELLTAYEDWALWMDLQRKGLRGEVIPRILYHYRVRHVSMVRQEGFSNHKELMGLLVDRHFPVVDPREKDVLVTLFQIAGHAINGIMHGRPEPVDYAHVLKQRLAYVERYMPGVVKIVHILGGHALQILRRMRHRIVLRRVPS